MICMWTNNDNEDIIYMQHCWMSMAIYVWELYQKLCTFNWNIEISAQTDVQIEECFWMHNRPHDVLKFEMVWIKVHATQWTVHMLWICILFPIFRMHSKCLSISSVTYTESLYRIMFLNPMPATLKKRKNGGEKLEKFKMSHTWKYLKDSDIQKESTVNYLSFVYFRYVL